MIRQLHSRNVVRPPTWVRRFTLASVAVTQLLSMLLGVYILSNLVSAIRRSDVLPVGHALFGFLLICSGVGGMIAVCQDWRHGKPFNQDRMFVGAIVLLGLAISSLVLFSR